MLGREIDDLELKMLEAGDPTVLSESEKVEGLIKRLRRLEAENTKVMAFASQADTERVRQQRQQQLADGQRRRFLEEADALAKQRGGPHVFNRWRNWKDTPFDMQDVCVGILEALNHHGIVAWNGDGVSIVAQMVEAGHRRAEKAEKERDEYKGGVMAVHELCDRANVPHDLEHPDGKMVLVTELPAWKRVENLVMHWQNVAMTTVNPMIGDAKKLADSIDFSGLKTSEPKAKTSKSRPRGRKVKEKP